MIKLLPTASSVSREGRLPRNTSDILVFQIVGNGRKAIFRILWPASKYNLAFGHGY